MIKDNPVLAGTDIKNPEQNYDQRSNEPIVDDGVLRPRQAVVRQDHAATSRSAAQDNALGLGNSAQQSHHFAIVLDNELVSTPYIDLRREPRRASTARPARRSPAASRSSRPRTSRSSCKIGALPIDLELISRSQVSATLGKQALDQGLLAAIVGFVIVALFLLIFYRVAGIIAVVALGIYALYFYALIKLIPITLTLPGIAGLILTLGVAADANIVIFERIKEEIRRGRSIAAGIAEGYRKGFSTIVDANVVTLLVAFILFILATAGVKGFAFTLGIGTIVSLFTAVLATQAILLSLRGSKMLASRQALGAGEQRHRWTFDFMGASRWFFSISGVILLIGALAIAGKGLNFGIDFESGSRIKASYKQPVSVEDVRQAMEDQGLPNPEDRRRQRSGSRPEPDPDLHRRPQARPGRRGHGRTAGGRLSRRRGADRTAEHRLDRPDVRQIGRQLGAGGDHRLADGHLDVHRAALRVEVRGAGAHRADARHPDHSGRLRTGRPGGDDVDGRGVAHNPGLLSLRHDHRVRPCARERAADAQRSVLPDRQPLDVRGAHAFAGNQLLHGAAGDRR